MKQITGNLPKKFFLLFTLLSAILIGAGFGVEGKWFLEIFILLLIALIYLSIKFNWRWGFNIFLISNSILAIMGILMGAPSILMVAGVAATLASWELSTYQKQYKEMYTHTQSVVYEKNRLRLLFISIGSGTIVTGIIIFVQFQLPFFVIYLLAIIILFCFYQISRLLDLSN